MHLTRTIKIQLAIFIVVALTAMAIVGLAYMRLPATLFGVGHYTVKVELAEAANLYTSANVALLPRNGTSPPLKNGDVIARDRTSVPPNISSLLDAASRGVAAIPHDNLKTVI